MRAEEVIADFPGYRMTYYKSNSEHRDRKKLIITFGGINSHINNMGFGVEFLTKNGFDVIYVAQSKGSFYQKLSVDEFKEHIAEYCSGRSLYAYGSSLGAYAALYYGSSIGAKSLAFSPRCTLHPALISYNNKKYAGGEFLHDEIISWGEGIEHLIVYDPCLDVDALFVDNVVRPTFKNAKILAIENVGHTSIAVFQASKELKDFALSFFNDKANLFPDVDVLNNPNYSSKLAEECFYDGRGAEGIYYLERSLRTQPTMKALKLLTFADEFGANASLDDMLSDTVIRKNINRFFSKRYKKAKSVAGILEVILKHREMILEPKEGGWVRSELIRQRHPERYCVKSFDAMTGNFFYIVARLFYKFKLRDAAFLFLIRALLVGASKKSMRWAATVSCRDSTLRKKMSRAAMSSPIINKEYPPLRKRKHILKEVIRREVFFLDYEGASLTLELAIAAYPNEPYFLAKKNELEVLLESCECQI